MSLVCNKCRRLVRKDSIFYFEGTYTCKRCNSTHKIPKSYYQRGEMEIPILPQNTDLKVLKTEDELSIELPIDVFSKTLAIASVVVIVLSIAVLKQINSVNVGLLIFLLIIASTVLVFSLIKGLAKRTIKVDRSSIIYEKKLFFKVRHIEKLSDIVRIREIEIEMESENGKYISSRYIEIRFKNLNYFEFAYNLDKKDRDYVLAELKLVHFYNSIL